MSRQNKLKNIQENPEVDVLIIGGGINGIGTFRDLALQGIRVVLAEKDDYCSGASAGSSHMLHGGIRYLENAEFRLVQEALHERNRMFRNAPHYAKPLPTTIPMFRWMSGMLNAPLKFAGIMDKPSERGAAVIKIGLTMYDWYTRDDDMTPSHDFKMRASSLEAYPKLNSDIVCTATYYDGWMPYPERICMDLLRDASNANSDAIALNYLRAGDGDKDSVTLVDELTGKSYDIKPKVVINAAGPWIDFVNRAMGQQTTFIGGTKGSHLMLDHPELHEACGGTEFFFENSDGRIVLIFPFHNRVMVGTTDIRIENPEDAVCTDEEIDYILGMIPKVFPTIDVNRSHIVYTFSGVRPLPASEGSTGTISRDHSIRTVEKGTSDFDFPIHSLIGGKWTSWRAFSEEGAKTALKDIKQKRKVDTKYLSIGGGLNYPVDEQGRDIWLNDLQQKTELSLEQLNILFDRYGTYSEPVALFMSAENDTNLAHIPEYTQREVTYIAQNEAVERVDDFLQRRSALAILGYATPDTVSELANVIGKALGWDSEKISQEIERTNTILTQKHRMGNIQAV